MTPSTIGRYEVKSELGRGGMAILYRAFDPRFERDVAIKVLPHEFLYDETFLARFEQEAKAIARLEHVAIVPVYDFGMHEGQPYLVMRYMPGGSLADRIAREGPFDLDEAVRITARIADALDAAHRRGVIHRDVKPGNVLFDADGHAYLTDFGIVKLTESTAQLTGSGIVGTPSYMAPEMARPGMVSPLVDVYALGVMLYQMLAGRLPYDADTPIGQMMAHVTKPVPDVREARPDLPPTIQVVLDKALAKEPEHRCQSAGEVADRLCAILPDCVPDRTWARTEVADDDLYGTTPGPAVAPPVGGPGATMPESGPPAGPPAETGGTVLESGRIPTPPPSGPGGTVLGPDLTPTPPPRRDTGSTQIEPRLEDDGTLLEGDYAAPAWSARGVGAANSQSKRQSRFEPPRKRGIPIWVWVGGVAVAGGLVIGVIVLLLTGLLGNGGGAAQPPGEPTATQAPTAGAGTGIASGGVGKATEEAATTEPPPPTETPLPTETPVPVPAFRTVSLTGVTNGAFTFIDPPLGELTLGGVPFVIDGQFKTQAVPPPNDTYPTEVVIPVDAPRAFRLYLLVTAGDGFPQFAGSVIGGVYATCDGDEMHVADLVLGENLREWHSVGEIVKQAPDAEEVWVGEIEGIGYDGHLDMQTVDLPQACVEGALSAVRLTDVSVDTVGSMDPALNISGVTVEVYE